MAKFRPGIAVGQISGSVAGNTFAHNRYGMYIRNRAVPTKATSNYAQNIKAYLAASSQQWQGLTAAQQQAWKTWAQGNPITDVLGEQQVLSGHAACVMLNTRLRQIPDTPIDVPPTLDPPNALLTLTPTFDIGAGNFELAFTATPLGANERLQVRAAVVGSAGITYVKNLLKLVQTSAAAQASPLDIETATATRFGTLQVGDYVHIYANVIDDSTGLVSPPLIASGIITTS